MKQERQLYFIAIIPPEPIYGDAMQYKELFATSYNSKAALKSPPHITLHMPFRLKEAKEPQLIKVLRKLTESIDPFEIVLDGFSQFNQRTIFIDVAANDPLHDLFKAIMKSMKINLNIFNADYKNKGYNPHLTLAFRDLKKEAFKDAWAYFQSKSYHQQFQVKDFALLKHNGKNWDIHKVMSLNENTL